MTIQQPPVIVGVVLPAKRYQKHPFLSTPTLKYLPLMPSDLTSEHLHSLSVTIILHKLVDFLLPSHHLEAILDELYKWGGHVVDDIRQMQVLSDRRITCEMLRDITTKYPEFGISLPPTSECTTDTSLNLPVIRKPVVACAAKNSHIMCLYPTREPLLADVEYILQEFIPHHGVIYKIYIIGENVRVQVRPSLTLSDNLESPMPFDSQALKHSRPTFPGSQEHKESLQRIEPHMQRIIDFSNNLQRHLGLTLFGWDLILKEESEEFFVIDVNYFPGYEGVEFMTLLSQTLLSKSSQIIN